MDRTNLFSRGSTPPPPQDQQSLQSQQAPPPQSYREPAPASPPFTIGSILRDANPPTVTQQPSQPIGPVPYPPIQPTSNSAPTTPVSSATAASSSVSAGNPPTDRQTAILSLLGSVTSPTSNPVSIPAPPPPPSLVSSLSFVQQTQTSTPPALDSNKAKQAPATNEAQGKILLEQLMSGNAVKSNFQEMSQNPFTSSPPFSTRPIGAPTEAEFYQQPSYNSAEMLPHPMSQSSTQQLTQPPSPSRKSMFEFTSPFDTLTSSSAAQAKKRLESSHLSSASRDTEDSWTSVSPPADPKRKSMENLMDQLTRNQGPVAQPHRVEEPYGSEPIPLQTDPFMPRMAPPPVASMPLISPRNSPPQMNTATVQPQQQPRSEGSPVPHQPSLSGQVLVQGPPAGRTASPPRGNWKVSQTRPAPRGKVLSSPPSPTQTIIFDVSQGLENIQASRDYVKSTAIALVKVETTFLPGSTIGATHWVAYAMSKGRVRVISRSSGDRTLLQLPHTFPANVSVTDMAVYGNRLAGVTSDGGFVVWELPEVITDDVPGNVLLCVVPSNNSEPLHTVKWHPNQPDTLAVASDSKLYLINVPDAFNYFNGEPIAQPALLRIASVFPSNAPLVSFDFDPTHHAIATVSEDSVLTFWNAQDKVAFWSHKIAGEGMPSSVNFMDGCILLGRKSGTIFQLLPIMSDQVLSFIKFVNGTKDDQDMFGHVNYDSRIQTLWIANSRRESMIAFRLVIESSPTPSGEEIVHGTHFERVVEFVGPKATIHFVILSAEADPDGSEANAACVAAKVSPGELALVAFSVHSTGVDQILIRKEWYDGAFQSTNAPFPIAPAPVVVPPPPPPQPEVRQQRHNLPVAHNMAVQPLSQPIPSAPLRLRTPPSEEVEVEHGNKEEHRPTEGRGGKNSKGKNVGWKDKEDSSSKEKEKPPKGEPLAVTEASVGVSLSKEIRKVEENLHTRIGRLIAKELDKQHQRLEEARANEQAADFVRQEKILKLISTELTKNTTRVVESAVRGEVQTSVLPSLENITKIEVKAALNNQISKGLTDAIKQTLPSEMEKSLIKPEVLSQISRNLSGNLTPFIERYVKEAISKTLIPAYQAQSAQMHQELSREIHAEILGLKKEIINWQSEALRGQEALIRDMDSSIRTLSEQIKFLTMNMPSMAPPQHIVLPSRNSPGNAPNNQFQQSQQQPLHRPSNLANLGGQHPNYSPSSFQHAPPQLHGQWYGPPMPSTHGPQSQMNTQQAQPPSQNNSSPPEEWDDTYLAVLGTQDLKQLRELLARSNPEVIMPTNGAGPLSQAVILTLVHRLAAAIGETSPVDEAFKSSLWWLQRAATTLNTNDPLISPYTGRVLPNVQQMLNTTKQRLALLPGGPQLMDTTRLISDIQDTLSRKPM